MELPRPPALRAIIERTARLRARLGDELGKRPLVLPTSEFFPDEFRADPASVKRLVARLKRHAGMSDIPTQTRVVGGDDACGSGCGGGSCGTSRGASHGTSCSAGCGTEPEPDAPVARVEEKGDKWRLTVPAAELRHPVVLTTNLARALSFVFLAETLPDGDAIEAPADLTADLAGVQLGFGVLLLQGSYIYRKSCGGPSVARVTKLGPGELAIATALFAKLGGHRTRAAQRELDTTQSALFSEARAWVDSNSELVERLRMEPARVGRGDYAIADTQPWLVRVFGNNERMGKAEARDGRDVDGLADASVDDLDDLLATLPATPARRTKTATPADDELKQLVAEALDEAAQAEN